MNTLAVALAEPRRSTPKKHPTPADEPRWNVADVAGYLKVSPSWVYLRANGGEIPCLRFGAHIRFDPDIIRAYARGEMVAPGKVIAFKGGAR